jgi:peptidoglycan/xylan/chitin deacetylase (PgdA/CDA1 family)
VSDKAEKVVSSLPIVDAMSVDLEDYFHVEAFADYVSRTDWPRFESRVRRNTERILELFARYNCRATFFVLGWVAERDPALIREVASAGHEIGCHSYWHRRVNSLTQREFREDLRQARAAIEDASANVLDRERVLVGFGDPC